MFAISYMFVARLPFRTKTTSAGWISIFIGTTKVVLMWFEKFRRQTVTPLEHLSKREYQRMIRIFS